MKRFRDRNAGRGNSIIEMTFMAPWILFLMMGIFDFGFWAYSAISTANAARVAALYTASDPSLVNDQPGACALVRQEMRHMLNASSFLTGTCLSEPLQVTVTQPDAARTRVTVTYDVIPLFKIPGLGGRWTITRSSEMSVNPS